MPVLDGDILALVVEDIDDLDVLRNIAEALSISRHHPLRYATLLRLYQWPIQLSGEALEDSQKLVDLLFIKADCGYVYARRVRNLALHLGSTSSEDHLGDDYRRLSRSVLKLLEATTNLQHLSWHTTPIQNLEIINALSTVNLISSLSIECSPMSSGHSLYDNRNNLFWEIEPLFCTLGKQLTSLDLQNVSERAFNIISRNFPFLIRLRDLRLDITLGRYEQEVRSGRFSFPKLECHIQRFELVTPDDVIASGPYNIIETSCLEELVLRVIRRSHCLPTWDIHMFSDLLPRKFSRLVHLEIEEDVWDTLRYKWDNNILGVVTHIGRNYYGLLRFLSELPCLRHLLVSEYALMFGSVWDRSSSVPDHDHARFILENDEWSSFAPSLRRLETLRVGLGPLNVHLAAELLDLCDPHKLSKFGFDWDWKALHQSENISPDLLKTLSKYPLLTDIHILTPRPQTRYPQFDAHTILDVQRIFAACPNVSRVGIGKNIVWERQTPAFPSVMPCSIRLMSTGKNLGATPRFYNAGSTDLARSGIFERERLINDTPKENIMIKEMLELLI